MPSDLGYPGDIPTLRQAWFSLRLPVRYATVALMLEGLADRRRINRLFPSLARWLLKTAFLGVEITSTES